MSNTARNLKSVNTNKATKEEIEHDFKVSGKTSIFRCIASAPLRLLIKKGWISGSVLNYGKGRYNVDSDAIKALGLPCSDYDYTYADFPEVLGNSFSTVFAGYVTNTLPIRSRKVVWAQIASTTRKDGFAFIAARSDKDRAIKGTPHGDGVITSVGTFQKGYRKGELLTEALRFFKYAVEVEGCPSGFRIVMCSHSDWS